MKEAKNKFGFWSIVLLGINAIVGTGIFLLPNKAYAVIGSASLGVLFFDALLAGCIALCFAEAAAFLLVTEVLTYMRSMLWETSGVLK